jgi:hypothetical protein
LLRGAGSTVIVRDTGGKVEDEGGWPRKCVDAGTSGNAPDSTVGMFSEGLRLEYPEVYSQVLPELQNLI